jgi:predicted metal-dependent hydrolase
MSVEDLPVDYVRSERARRYTIRICRDRKIKAVIPRNGSLSRAREFVLQNWEWIQSRLANISPETPESEDVWIDGVKWPLVRGDAGISLANQLIATDERNIRWAIERMLRLKAVRELPPRLIELAREHHLRVNSVTIRAQRSRWGSCSAKGNISLNWRLVQTPTFVRDYILLHELMHLRVMNHSKRFWHEVESVCPAYLDAEAWLKQHRIL